ncbi:MAG: YebC/PmpR family DNA-binding transcriptional regulator [Candidatus Marinimicrobia bacterium]|nr:YebC/PmpR family DNA-binding transcriptional regulator [Candidatus Neomarinimicrobiota bacterium]
MAGHSKWANIKHRKGAQDQKRGKIFTKLIKEITISARLFGGELNANPRLRKAVNNAKANNMPADKIDRAIKKGAGDLPGIEYEEITYEGYGPNGVAIMIEVITDNKNRTVAEIRNIFSKFGGSLGENGSVSWLFIKKGHIVLQDKDKKGFEAVFDSALLAGVEDIKKFDNNYIILTSKESLQKTSEILEKQGYIIKSTDYEMYPKSEQKIEKNEADNLIKLLDTLDNNDDVNRLYSNLEII